MEDLGSRSELLLLESFVAVTCGGELNDYLPPMSKTMMMIFVFVSYSRCHLEQNNGRKKRRHDRIHLLRRLVPEEAVEGIVSSPQIQLRHRNH